MLPFPVAAAKLQALPLGYCILQALPLGSVDNAFAVLLCASCLLR